jgi:hypothetical protein
MKRFSVGQKWKNKDAVYGPFFGEVIETSDVGRRGTVVITDDQGNVLDTYRTPPGLALRQKVHRGKS